MDQKVEKTTEAFLVPDSNLQAIVQSLDWIQQNADPLVISEDGMVFSNSPETSTIMENFGWVPANDQQKTQLFPDWNNSDRDLAIIVPGDNSHLKSPIFPWKIGNRFNKVVV